MNVPPVRDEAEREELRRVYLQIAGLHRKSFEECLADSLIRGCLRNTALAIRRAQEERRRQDPGQFELAP